MFFTVRKNEKRKGVETHVSKYDKIIGMRK